MNASGAPSKALGGNEEWQKGLLLTWQKTQLSCIPVLCGKQN